MGTFINPGNARFVQTLNSDIYVDKTGLIINLNSVLNTEQKYVCVSRPRRFGKSVTAGMICAYYDKTAKSRELFEGREIAKTTGWDKYLAKYDVVRIVTTDFMKKRIKDLILMVLLKICSLEWLMKLQRIMAQSQILCDG